MMRPRSPRWSVVILIVMLCGSLLALAPGRPARAFAPLAVPAATVGHVTIIVLDMSGSMSQNDPDGLRCSAANAYIDLSGVGDAIGVVGLDNNNGTTGGAHNYQLAQKWSDPVDMSTQQARHALQQTIASKSNGCKPDSTTPTYDALNQALGMLQTATHGGQSGSVILLTDGTPAPQTNAQISAIQSELTPQFKAHGWPVDTVALGADPDGSFHSFLNSIASATSGAFYDDAHGDVPGVSPLNIAPFFVKIFELRHSGVTTQRDIAPTQLSGGVTSRNFDVTDYVQSLAVVVVKDNAGATAALRTPTGQRLDQSSGGVQVSSDPHYVIFNIDQPQAGAWELDVSGSGQFLMYSAKISAVGVAITSPTALGPAHALGQGITVTATLTNAGQAITDHHFTLQGQITYGGGTGQYAQGFALDDAANPGTFVGTVTVPLTAPAGTYTVQIDASGASGAAVVASATQTLRVQLFPEPLFVTQGTPTRDPVFTSVTQWPFYIQWIYGLPVGFIQWLSQWPLDGKPATTSALLNGRVYVGGTPYTNATVTGNAMRVGTKTSIPVTVVNDGGGKFHILFPATASGDYAITFTTNGTFKDSHGDLTTFDRIVHVTVQPAPLFWLVLLAILKTLLYGLVVYLLYTLAGLVYKAKPQGAWRRSDDGDAAQVGDFSRIRNRGPLQSFQHPNVVYSQQVGMPRGLRLRFKHGGAIEVAPHGAGGQEWVKADGSMIQKFTLTKAELTYRPGAQTYTFEGAGNGQPGGGRSAADGRSTRATSSWDEEDQPRPTRHTAPKRASVSARSASRSPRKTRGTSRWDDDDD